MASRRVFDMVTRPALAIVVAVFACGGTWSHAEDVTQGGLKISAAWTRATPKGAPVGAGYLKITNTGTAPDRLIGGSSDTAMRFEIHNMSMDNGVMKMRPMESGIEIKPGQTVELKPGGYHVMFVGLKKSFEQGDHVNATLKFEKAGDVRVDFTVEGIGAQTGGMQMEHGH
jgi:periplasmic copper chaperone A